MTQSWLLVQACMHILQDFLTGRGGLNGFLHLLPIMDPVLRTSHTQLFGRGEKVIVHVRVACSSVYIT